MAQVGIDLVTNSDVAAEAEKAAKGFEKIVRQEELVQRVANQLGTKDIPAVTKAIAEQEKAMAKATAQVKAQEAATAKASKAQESAAKKAKLEQEKAAKSAITAQKLQQAEVLKSGKGIKALLSGNALEAGEKFGLTAAAVAGVTLAVVAATVATLALLGGIAKVATEAREAEMSAFAMMQVLTGGRGSDALAMLDGLAEELGIKFQTARDRFIQFRQAGADNSTSAALLKLTADLDAIDPSGKLAEEAIKKTLGHKKADGTLDIAAAKAEMALLAKQADVAGDGTLSAASRFTTLRGAINSLDNTKTLALQKIGEKIGPAIDSAAGSVAKFAEEFLKSERGQKVIDDISSAISFVANVIEASLPFVGAIIEGIVDGFENVKIALAPVGQLFGDSFGGDKASAIETIRAVVSGLTTAIGIVVTVIGGLVAAGTAMLAVFTNPIAVILALKSALGSMGETAAEAGSNMVDGVISGITNKAGALYATIKNVAANAWASFKSTLGIASPSTAFAESGVDMGSGVEVGFDKGAPDTKDIATRMIPEPSALKAATAPMAADAAASMTPEKSAISAATGPLESALSPASKAVQEALSAAGLSSTGSLMQSSQAAPLQPLEGSAAAPPTAAPAVAAGGTGGPLIVIENLTAMGGTAEENARSVRRELETLLTAIQVSRGRV